MNQQALQESLKQLHQQLQENPALEPETQALLTALAADIDRLQSQGKPEDWIEQLEKSVLSFEEQYPTLGATVRELIQVLGRMGI